MENRRNKEKNQNMNQEDNKPKSEFNIKKFSKKN